MYEFPISLKSYEACKCIFEVNGKIKSREIEIIFEYMSIDNEDNEDNNMVYLRQLKVPVNIMVHKVLILRDLDFMPAISDVNFINEIKNLANFNEYNYFESEEEEKKEDKYKIEETNTNTIIKQAETNLNMDDYCILSLILYNKSYYSFDIEFYVRNDDNGNIYMLFFFFFNDHINI